MTDWNPYESPQSAATGHEDGGRLPFDVGKFVGRYLQGLACLSVVSMVVELVFFDRLDIDLSFIFLFWASAYLIRHSPTARKWVIAVSGLAIFVSVALVVLGVVVGTEGMSVTIGRRIENPSLGHVVAVASLLVIMAGIPFTLLLTRQAKREFTRGTNAG